MECQSCHENKPDVRERLCVYHLEITDQEVLETVCDACEQEHCYDI